MGKVIKTRHQAIMISEVLEYLKPVSEGTYLDATFGGGGHSRAILEASKPKGRVVGIDLDPSAEIYSKELSAYGERFSFVNLNYVDVKRLGILFDGALMDLGLSSDQLESTNGEGRGFSFQGDEPLDLRFDPSSGQTAAQLLNQSSVSRLEQIFRDYAQDRFYKKIAGRIVQTRRAEPIRTANDLIKLIGTEQPKVLAPIWQALRIAVNSELNNVTRGLEQITEVLKKDGVVAVISFHSLEDAIVKKFFRDTESLEVLTKKPIQPSNEEVRDNPRARSAKLRVARKR